MTTHPLLLLFSILIYAAHSKYALTPEEVDQDITLDSKPEHIGKHELFGSLARSRRSGIDLIVLFYHPECPHCHLFLPKFYDAVNLLKKEHIAVEFYMADCGIHPQYVPAF